jgi:hypothetical protein
MATLVKFVRLQSPGLVEELYQVHRAGTDYLIHLQHNPLSFGIVASGSPAEVSEAFRKKQEDLQDGVIGYGKPEVVTTTPDEKALRALGRFEDPTWGLTWKDVPIPADRDVFDTLLARQFREWRGGYRFLALTNHRYWPTFLAMVHEAVRAEYGDSLRLYRGIYEDQATAVKHGGDLLVREFSSWTGDEAEAREIARFGSAHMYRHRQWLVVSSTFSVKQVVFAPVVLPDYVDPRILMGLGKEDEFVIQVPGGVIPHERLRMGRSGKATNPARAENPGAPMALTVVRGRHPNPSATDLVRKLKF